MVNNADLLGFFFLRFLEILGIKFLAQRIYIIVNHNSLPFLERNTDLLGGKGGVFV